MVNGLVQLQHHHAGALENFLRAFDATPGDLHGYFCPRDWPIERVVEDLQNLGQGVDIKSGWVPCSTYFWEHDGELQGVINIRHHLNPGLEQTGGHVGFCVAPDHRQKGVATRMLASALEHCRGLGITRALLTCDSANGASARTIESAGGKLERDEWLESEKCHQRWYWIDLAAPH
ncbi:MAG: GNAT family N-acetyltransferase [Planctomycetota bacterium]|nr:GNAT family N-acetyltransferase [Planctomycetota bacterium]